MRQKGFSSVLLIAIIVLLAGMTTFALRFVTSSQGGAAMRYQAQRVQRAADAAIEWQRYRLRNLGVAGCQATTSFNMPFSTGNVPVTVTCQRTPVAMHTETAPPANKNYYTYTFSATACMPSAGGVCPNPAVPAGYVAKQVTAVAACTTSLPPAPPALPAVCTW